ERHVANVNVVSSNLIARFRGQRPLLVAVFGAAGSRVALSGAAANVVFWLDEVDFNIAFARYRLSS
ncbi:MAG: hypothetical protein KAT00_03260, partial [Planctomycetes bacterium]|nr:hypothetical protein [Planctomycetota bacterium]